MTDSPCERTTFNATIRVMMSLQIEKMVSRQSNLNDDFFGDEEDCTDRNQVSSDSMAQHETHAREEQYRNIGYLEAFESSKEVRLQEGFEDGYREVYDVALRVGELLGVVVAQSLVGMKRCEGADNKGPTINPNVKVASETVRQSLMQMDQSETDAGQLEALQQLESRLSEISMEHD